MCTFLVYFLWIEICKKNFEDTYFNFKILKQAWISTIKARMVTWKDLTKTRTHETLEAKANLALIKVDFITTWSF